MLDLLRTELTCPITAEAEALQKYGLDWTRFYIPAPLAVVFPLCADDVVSLVKFANRHGLALVPSGGRTGLSGGAVANNGELVVSFEKMNKILDYEPVDQCVVLQPGVITQQLQAFAEAHDCLYPVDFASSGSSQIGGNIATNAGGIKVLRYGLTRDWVAGLKVVTGTGELLDLNKGLVKNATGYDFRHLFIGSEGTLGMIVEATIRLAPKSGDLHVLLLAVPEMTKIIAVLEAFRQKVHLTAYEFFSEAALQHVIHHTGATHPFGSATAFYALIEYETLAAEDQDASLAAFEACVEAGWAVDGVVSASEAQRRDLWRLRENISESITRFTPYKNDIAVRVSKVPDFLAAVDAEVGQRYPDFEIVWFGHIGDGNLHLNILKPAALATATFKAQCEQVSEYVMALVARFEGSVSAEHGVGLLKKGQLHHTRSATEIALMQAVKSVFDPNNIMNPGKLLP
ncbi:MAG: FAD-binding oxidoreductase [Pseudomonadales bacterium]|jgi:FAD/FMN-containing dehydrogenase|nr:FAD-binding oxidoreductase [Pseudomonadales bacterium]MDP4641096.1 FAD-binding oxidoreductase [Pseudomonadales bacterium]MDP4766113.1 FAD-binding oxidoreductase [Pseudomonadales bacterium]MDP4875099.1 FAD-binding oxidoreductase [Pseudomonadales bacterium]MDP4910714.1 FAD-binding oxidoreductase [Pseudomonadales bacterium]